MFVCALSQSPQENSGIVPQSIMSNFRLVCAMGRHAVVQLVEALCYKVEGREFDSQ
jgi:hypothetical protein